MRFDLSAEQLDQIANGNYRGQGGQGGQGGSANYAATLPQVSDPEKAYADITRGEFNDYVANYRDFEMELLDRASNDTSLIDQARTDSTNASALTAGIASRNASRYGGRMTPAQQQAMDRNLERGNVLGSVKSIADARIAQDEANTALMSDLINIGQGVNRSSQQQLGNAAQDASARKQAYSQAKAASKANTYSTIGSLGAMAIFAMAF
jgi:hypothetical protein